MALTLHSNNPWVVFALKSLIALVSARTLPAGAVDDAVRASNILAKRSASLK